MFSLVAISFVLTERTHKKSGKYNKTHHEGPFRIKQNTPLGTLQEKKKAQACPV